MTSEQYAATVAATVLSVYDGATMSDPEKDLYEMAVRRAIGGGAEYALEPDVQSVEVKPLADLVRDVREEAADQINYAVAIGERVPDAAHVAGMIIRHAMDTAKLCAQLDALIGE